VSDRHRCSILYRKEGRPALSPVLLALVLVFQALDSLPDRRATEAVECNLKWKHALHLPFNAAGFDASVLCEFRKRLITHSAEARVFDAVLTQMQAFGLVKARGIQRTDSLCLFSSARDLGRLKLLFETIRCVLHDLLKVDADWLRATIPTEWAERYRYHCRIERLSEAERAALTLVIGDDGQWLLDTLDAEDAPAGLNDRYIVSVLRTIWHQQFETVEGHVQFRPKGGIGGGERIETPYDPEARWSDKRGQGWVGYKLQVSETEDEDLPHLITDIAVTAAIQPDSVALADIQERQVQRNVLPKERYVDSGYVGGNTIAASRLLGEELIGPLRRGSSPQQRRADGLTHADFQIDFEHKQVTCPQGHTTVIFSAGKLHDYQATFAAKTCRNCSLRSRCCAGMKEGRSLIGNRTRLRLYGRTARSRSAWRSKRI